MRPGTALSPGDVVQLSPGDDTTFFNGCFMLVTEPKAFGAQGFIALPDGPRGSPPKRAYCRATWEEMEYVGRATWVPDDVMDAE